MSSVQTPRDQANCIDFLEQVLNIQHRNDEILSYQSKRIYVKAYPIGVHPAQIQKQAAESQVTDLPFDLDKKHAHKTIISVDRIDYSKGLLEKIHAFQGCWMNNLNLKSVPAITDCLPMSTRCEQL